MTTTNETMKNSIKCCFCDEVEQYGNNPAPFEVERGERCCDYCNQHLVIAARVRAASYKGDKKVVGVVKIKDKATGLLEKTFYYTYGNLEGEDNDECLCGGCVAGDPCDGEETDSDDEALVEGFDSWDEMIAEKTKLNALKTQKLKNMLNYIKSRHSFQGMNVMADDGEMETKFAPSWFKKIGAEGTNYYEMIGRKYPEFQMKFGEWLMPVFYIMTYIKDQPFKINGEFGDWSVGNAGSVWLDLRMKIPLVDGTAKKCVFRVAFYFNRSSPLSICEFHESKHSAECVNADMTAVRLQPMKNAKEDAKRVRKEAEEAERLLKEQEKLFREKEKAEEHAKFLEEQRERERAWRAKVEADRIVAETEEIRKRTELLEQNRQLIAQKEKERLAEAKAEKAVKAAEAAAAAEAKKAAKEAERLAKYAPKSKK